MKPMLYSCLLTACGFALLGCAGPDLSAQGLMRVERVPNDHVSTTWVRVHEESDGVRIAGGVDPHGWSYTSPHHAHVDVQVFSASGELVAEGSAAYQVQRANQSPSRPTTFSTTIASSIPHDATIQIVHHLGYHSLTPAD